MESSDKKFLDLIDGNLIRNPINIQEIIQKEAKRHKSLKEKLDSGVLKLMSDVKIEWIIE